MLYIRRLLLPSMCILFILCLIFFSVTAVKSASRGIELWLYIVFPSLFPFFVGSELLNRSGFVKAAGILLEPVMRPLFNVPGCGSFALALGITSGYPVGAKITASLREDKLISRTEAERLLTFTNNSGPLFIVGAVAVGMFKMPGIGLVLLFCHIAACITVGFSFRFYRRKESGSVRKNKEKLFLRFKKELLCSREKAGGNPVGMFGDAVRDSMMTLLAIGGFIVFFSVIINVLIDSGVIGFFSGVLAFLLRPLGVSKDLLLSLLSGFFEITTGSNTASKAADASLIGQLTTASMIIGWAGLSVHSQVASIVGRTDISIKPYLLGKFLQGVIAALYTYIVLKTMGSGLLESKQAFYSFGTPLGHHWYDYFLNSSRYLILSLAIISLCMALTSAAIKIHFFRKRSRTRTHRFRSVR